jgi:hypothetical protein
MMLGYGLVVVYVIFGAKKNNKLILSIFGY